MTEINNKIKNHVCEILESVHSAIKNSNSNKEINNAIFNNNTDFFFGYPRNIKFNFNLLLDHSTQDVVNIEFEVPFILKKKFMNE
jgi:hypothetical protein